MNVAMNKQGYDSIDAVMQRGLVALSPGDFEAAANSTGALVLDTRGHDSFVKGFIPNSINIGIDGTFAPWVGALIPDVKQQLLLVTEPGQEEEAVTRLARVGYDHVIGYLDGGMESWLSTGRQKDTVTSVTAKEFATLHASDKQLKIVDIRRHNEFEKGHLADATNLPLDYISDHMAEFPKEGTFYVHCAGGYRSVIASSILKARGFDNVVNVEGGYAAIKHAHVPA
jgi:rhodanese-related sulfurtransferase